MDFQLKYIQAVKCKRTGKTYYYFRRGGVSGGAIDGDPGSPEFIASYQRIAAGFAKSPSRPSPGTFDDLISKYYAGPEFAALAPSSKSSYRTYGEVLRQAFGRFKVSDIKRRHVLALRDRLSDKPSACNLTMKIAKLVFEYGIDREWIEANPAMKLKQLKTGEHLPWTDDEVERFIEGAEPELAFAVLLALFTGQRISDVVRMSWTDIEDGGINVRQQKTGTQLWIPMHPELAEALPLIPKRGVTILTEPDGRSWTPGRLRERLRKTLPALKIYKVFHGLRKTAAVRLAEAGCSEEEIKSITGHQSSQVLAHYTKSASQKRRARSAIAKLSVYRTVKQ